MEEVQCIKCRFCDHESEGEFYCHEKVKLMNGVQATGIRTCKHYQPKDEEDPEELGAVAADEVILPPQPVPAEKIEKAREGVKKMSSSAKLDKEKLLPEMIRLYVDEKMSTMQVAEKMKISGYAAYELLKKAGVMRPHYSSQKTNDTKSDAQCIKNDTICVTELPGFVDFPAPVDDAGEVEEQSEAPKSSVRDLEYFPDFTTRPRAVIDEHARPLHPLQAEGIRERLMRLTVAELVQNRMGLHYHDGIIELCWEVAV